MRALFIPSLFRSILIPKNLSCHLYRENIKVFCNIGSKVCDRRIRILVSTTPKTIAREPTILVQNFASIFVPYKICDLLALFLAMVCY